MKPKPQPWCDECKKPKCECDWKQFLIATEFYRVLTGKEE
jgi:hypothetical protein